VAQSVCKSGDHFLASRSELAATAAVVICLVQWPSSPCRLKNI